jgi:Mn2+/Fe2+ NRAMP family transporter
MFAIIVATVETLHVHGDTNIQSAAQAAEALKPFAGHFASTIFALGFIGSGLLAIPVLAGSGSVGMNAAKSIGTASRSRIFCGEQTSRPQISEASLVP